MEDSKEPGLNRVCRLKHSYGDTIRTWIGVPVLVGK
jgi:hypothetical protein